MSFNKNVHRATQNSNIIILNGQLKCQSTTKIWALFNQCNMQYAGHRSITVSFCSTLHTLFALFAPYSPISLGYKMIFSPRISLSILCFQVLVGRLWLGCQSDCPPL